jgi:hypothetical protein
MHLEDGSVVLLRKFGKCLQYFCTEVEAQTRRYVPCWCRQYVFLNVGEHVPDHTVHVPEFCNLNPDPCHSKSHFLVTTSTWMNRCGWFEVYEERNCTEVRLIPRGQCRKAVPVRQQCAVQSCVYIKILRRREYSQLKLSAESHETHCLAHKAIPLQAWTGPEGSRRLRLSDFKTIGTWRC